MIHSPAIERTPDPAGLLSRVRAEQVRRWRAGERPSAEDFLARHPDLAADAEAAQVLVYGEALLREEIDGTPPIPAEYAARFPTYADALAVQFELHGALAGPTAPPDLPGFAIVRELGRGGMGVVYLARETALGRLVAVKVLLSGEFASPAACKRFRTEAEAIARLTHPHIVAVHALGEHEGRPYLVLEYVPGGSLDRATGGTPVPPREAAALVQQLADAVQYAHDHGIVHRDLKPANVLLRNPEDRGQRTEDRNRTSCPLSSFCPLISDFGLAKQLDAGDGPTATSQILGTPSYMAPEQAAGVTAVGPAADIYALGAILYECLTGRPPFKAATPLETLAQIADREPVPPRALNPAVPRDLETVCLKCLAKGPANRYTTAGKLADDLGRFFDGQPVVARPVGAIGRAWRWAKRRRAVAGLAAALALLIPAALITTTVLHLRAERRGLDILAYRLESVERMSRLTLAASGDLDPVKSAELHRACADEFERLADAGIDPPRCRLERAWQIAWTAFALVRMDDHAQALAVADEAIGAFERSLAEQPGSLSARQGLFEVRFRRATAFRRLGRWAEGLNLLDELVVEAPAVYGGDPSLAMKLKLTLRDLHQGRASALSRMGCYSKSAAALDEALRRDDGTKWTDLTIMRAVLRARGGQAAEAVESLYIQLANPHLTAWETFNAACGYAQASAAEDLPAPSRAAAADLAVATLRRALAIDPRLQAELQKDGDLRPLYGRPDFQVLMSGK
jgi:tetratricopeptide (TPR) repeat protein